MLPGSDSVEDELSCTQRVASSASNYDMTTGFTGFSTQVDEVLEMDIY